MNRRQLQALQQPLSSPDQRAVAALRSMTLIGKELVVVILAVDR